MCLKLIDRFRPDFASGGEVNVLNSRISSTDSEDWFKLTASAGQVVEIHASAALAGVTPVIELYAKQNRFCGNLDENFFDCDVGGGAGAPMLRDEFGSLDLFGSYLDFVAPYTGQYWIRVKKRTGYPGSGGYILTTIRGQALGVYGSDSGIYYQAKGLSEY